MNKYRNQRPHPAHLLYHLFRAGSEKRNGKMNKITLCMSDIYRNTGIMLRNFMLTLALHVYDIVEKEGKMKEQFEFKIEYGFATLEIKLPTEVMKDQFLVFLESGDRLSRINGDKLEEESTSQWETISQIEDWCKVRNVACELKNKTMFAKIMSFIDRQINKEKGVGYDFSDK